MGTPLLTWLMLAGIIAVIFAIDGISVGLHRLKRRKRNTKVLENGTEREMLFIPGDPLGINMADEDYEEYEEF